MTAHITLALGRLMRRAAGWGASAAVAASLLMPTSCIEPPLHLPAEDLMIELPLVVTEMSLVWNTDHSWLEDWYYGWDETDERISGSLEYPVPTNYEVRRYFLGDRPGVPHTREGMDGFTIFATKFKRTFNFGYYDLLVWSNIDSSTGTQVLLVNESDIQTVTATTTATRGLLSDVNEGTVHGIYNRPEIFYSAYKQDVQISRNLDDYVKDEETGYYTMTIKADLTPLVYIYLVQVILHGNDGRIVDVTGDASVSAFAKSTNVNTGHTSNTPCLVYFPMRLKKGIDYKGEKVDIVGGKLTTFGLCDMDGWTPGSRAEYTGTRTDLDNRLYLTLKFNNGQEMTINRLVTEQCRKRAHGGIITLHVNVGDIEPPSPDNPNKGDLFVPTIDDYENVDYDIPM